MPVGAPTIASSGRIGALLRRHRIEHGAQLGEISERSFGSFSRVDLEAIEQGRVELSPRLLDAVVDLYGVDRHLVRAHNSEVTLDLRSDRLAIGHVHTTLNAPTLDSIVDSYLDLVRAIRGLETAEPFVLRSTDLEVIGDALDLDPERVRGRIERRFEPPKAISWLERLRIFAGLGVLGAVVVGGAVVLVEQPWQPSDQVGRSVSQIAGVTTASATTTTTTAPASPAGFSIASFLPVVASNPETVAIGDAELTTQAAVVVAPELGSVALTERQRQIEDAIPWDFRGALATWEVRHGDPHLEWWGVTNSVERTVTLFDRPTTSIDDAAAVLVHELGHAVDLDKLTDTLRAEWMQMRGIPNVWWAKDGLSDFSVGAGDFAEAVAAAVVNSPSSSEYGDFTPDQLAFVARVLKS